MLYPIKYYNKHLINKVLGYTLTEDTQPMKSGELTGMEESSDKTVYINCA